MNAVDFLLEKSRSLDKDFIVGTEETISYKDLCRKVNGLALHIHEKIGTGKEIMLLSQNNVFFIISYLSIIKSGNVVIMLETRISEKDLEAVLNRCSLSGILVQSKFESKFDKFRHNSNLDEKIFTESILDGLSAEPEEKITVESSDDDSALVIFTSGSTGEKKGVMLTHKNIRANTESIIEYLDLKESDRIEAVLPFFYCYGLSLLNTHLRVGASMVLNRSIFLGSVINEIKQYECTGFSGVPSTYQILIARTNFLEQDFPSIRYFTQAGGKLADKFIKSIAEAFPQKLFYVMYGATEATSRLSFLPPLLVNEKIGSIGRGIPHVTLEVVDAAGQPVKPGEIGEITAKGDNVMKGYYKDPEDTGRVLKNGRFYTGDLATIDKDGFIYVKERANKMIKSAGYRIFPNEIEESINSLKGVLDCVVLGLPDDIMGEAVAAAVLAREPSEELKAEILSHCNRTFPSYKIPKHILFFEEFPLNSSYKKDMSRIKEMVSFKIEQTDNSAKENVENLDYLLGLEQYSLEDEKKNGILLKIIKNGLRHARNNKYINNLFEKEDINIDNIDCLEDVPVLPVQMFKYFDLATCPKDSVVRVLKSSGTTTNLPSRVPLNKNTMVNQAKALSAILSDYLGNKRKIFLVIDHEGINNPDREISARTAGVRGLSMHSRKIFYLLKEENGRLVLNMPVIKDVTDNFGNEDVYVFGFTHIIWSVFYEQIKERGKDVKFNFREAKIFHSGGWKRLEEEKVSKDAFSAEIGEIFGIDGKNVYDFYGMAEQTGIIFIDCREGNKHVPNFSQVIVRDIQTLRPCDVNEVGLIEVMSILSDSYYCQALLTEDKGYIAGIDNCPCGRKGRYFRFKDRVEKAELRGCGNTFRE
jgi:long-chain acyl-CoA synthetase